MKTSIIKKALLIFILFISIASFSQDKHEVILTCTSSEIRDTTVNDICSFGQNAGTSNMDFTIEVEKSDFVVWTGNQLDQNMGRIEITNIVYDNGVNIFKDKNISDREDGKQDGVVVGIVKNGKPGDILKYTVRFDVYDRRGSLVGNFSIDPKIRLREFATTGGR